MANDKYNEMVKGFEKKFKKDKKKTNKKSLTERAKKFGMDLFKIKKKKKKMRGSNVHRQPMIKRGDAESKQKKLRKYTVNR